MPSVAGAVRAEVGPALSERGFIPAESARACRRVTGDLHWQAMQSPGHSRKTSGRTRTMTIGQPGGWPYIRRRPAPDLDLVAITPAKAETGTAEQPNQVVHL